MCLKMHKYFEESRWQQHMVLWDDTLGDMRFKIIIFNLTNKIRHGINEGRTFYPICFRYKISYENSDASVLRFRINNDGRESPEPAYTETKASILRRCVNQSWRSTIELANIPQMEQKQKSEPQILGISHKCQIIVPKGGQWKKIAHAIKIDPAAPLGLSLLIHPVSICPSSNIVTILYQTTGFNLKSNFLWLNSRRNTMAKLLQEEEDKNRDEQQALRRTSKNHLRHWSLNDLSR